MFSFVLLSRLQANHCWMYKKMTMFKKNTNTLNYPISSQKKSESLKNRIVRGVWIFSRILSKFVISNINYYTFDKSNHLELSDSILGHSQIFSDTIQIVEAHGQAICVKLWLHKTTVIVVKLLIKGLCWEKFDEKCKIFKN